MGHSSLLGTEKAAAQPAGTGNDALGPSDNSDSGSDRVGIADSEGTDPGLPVDVAMGSDQSRSLEPDSAGAGDSDSGGTGERGSAGGDAGLREGSDIGVDHIVPRRRARTGAAADDGRSDDEDVDLGFIDEVQAGDVLDEEDDDIEAADLARPPRDPSSPVAATPQPPPPTRPNPEPDVPSPGDDGADLPDEADEAEDQRPGRA